MQTINSVSYTSRNKLDTIEKSITALEVLISSNLIELDLSALDEMLDKLSERYLRILNSGE